MGTSYVELGPYPEYVQGPEMQTEDDGKVGEMAVTGSFAHSTRLDSI